MDLKNVSEIVNELKSNKAKVKITYNFDEATVVAYKIKGGIRVDIMDRHIPAGEDDVNRD